MLFRSIYKSEYEGLYCTPCESFWTESQLDENGCCPDCHREVKKAKEEAYFLRLSKYQKQLEEFIENNENFIYPEARKKEMLNNFIKPGFPGLWAALAGSARHTAAATAAKNRRIASLPFIFYVCAPCFI